MHFVFISTSEVIKTSFNKILYKLNCNCRISPWNVNKKNTNAEYNGHLYNFLQDHIYIYVTTYTVIVFAMQEQENNAFYSFSSNFSKMALVFSCITFIFLKHS